MVLIFGGLYNGISLYEFYILRAADILNDYLDAVEAVYLEVYDSLYMRRIIQGTKYKYENGEELKSKL